MVPLSSGMISCVSHWFGILCLAFEFGCCILDDFLWLLRLSYQITRFRCDYSDFQCWFPRFLMLLYDLRWFTKLSCKWPVWGLVFVVVRHDSLCFLIPQTSFSSGGSHASGKGALDPVAHKSWNRRSDIVVNTGTNAAVPQKPFLKLAF